MANYIVQDTSLETVADSIRAKAGISEKLVFPDGWKAAVDNISVGSAPDGSAVTFGYENGEPVEREEQYAITSADLNTLGAAVQNVCDVKYLLTVSGMATHINGIQAGGGNSGGLAFSSAASGYIVDFDHGYASSTFTLAKFLVSNADGELQEG